MTQAEPHGEGLRESSEPVVGADLDAEETEDCAPIPGNVRADGNVAEEPGPVKGLQNLGPWASLDPGNQGSRSPCPAVGAMQLDGWGHQEGAVHVVYPRPLPPDQGHRQPPYPFPLQKCTSVSLQVWSEGLGEAQPLTGSRCLGTQVAFMGLINGLAPPPPSSGGFLIANPHPCETQSNLWRRLQGPWRECVTGWAPLWGLPTFLSGHVELCRLPCSRPQGPSPEAQGEWTLPSIFQNIDFILFLFHA